jgi:predicted nucleic acid-binding protein
VAPRVLIDNSAWVRLADSALSEKRRNEVAGQLEAGEVATCLPFLLETGYSTRNARDYEEIVRELRALPHLVIDDQVEDLALDAHRQLARVGHHRLPPVDILVAAIGHRHNVAVLHYDRDYDLIRTKTDLDFESVWLARRGTLS